MKEIENGANIVELIESDLLKGRKIQKNIVFDNFKAQLIVDDQYIIDIEENLPVHYLKSGKRK